MGSYDHSLDAKGRMIIPSKFREGTGRKVRDHEKSGPLPVHI